MQQRWEYLVRTRHRDKGWLKIKNWKDDVEKDLTKLGNECWELVSVTSQSGIFGNGMTTDEVWVFKRPKPINA